MNIENLCKADAYDEVFPFLQLNDLLIILDIKQRLWEETYSTDSKLASGKRLLQTIKRGNWEIKDEEGKSVATVCLWRWSSLRRRVRCPTHSVGRNKDEKSEILPWEFPPQPSCLRKHKEQPRKEPALILIQIHRSVELNNQHCCRQKIQENLKYVGDSQMGKLGALWEKPRQES